MSFVNGIAGLAVTSILLQDFMISSPLMDGEYVRLVPDYGAYRARTIQGLPPTEIPGSSSG